jgi:L-ascorbate oxidase
MPLNRILGGSRFSATACARGGSSPITAATRAAALPVMVAAVSLQAGIAFAQTRERLAVDPPTAQIQRPATPAMRAAPGALLHLGLPPSPVSPGIGREAFLDLNIDFTDAKIYNPATDRYDAVRLRSYRDVREVAPPPVPFVAPTIDLLPG